MYLKFQYYKHPNNKQYMSYGDKDSGTLFLYEVPPNLRNCQPGEIEAIETFWDKEIEKCNFIITQREQKKEEYQAIKLE